MMGACGQRWGLDEAYTSNSTILLECSSDGSTLLCGEGTSDYCIDTKTMHNHTQDDIRAKTQENSNLASSPISVGYYIPASALAPISPSLLNLDPTSPPSAEKTLAADLRASPTVSEMAVIVDHE